MVNHYYFYCVDSDFGPFFLKFCSYFPYNAKLCINGNEYAKRQLAKRGIAYEALDNGVLSCEDPAGLQRICDGLDAKKIDHLLRKWPALLPHPFDRRARAAGYRYALAILQAEFALTQVLDRPVSGRIFFEQVIREYLDIGRPGQVATHRRSPCQSAHARAIPYPGDYRGRHTLAARGLQAFAHQAIPQGGAALRTEATINGTHDFGIGRLLHNLPELRRIGLAANRRLLHIEQISHDWALGDDAFQDLQRPRQDAM